MANARRKDNAMCSRNVAVAALCCLAVGIGACRQQVVVDPNNAPLADARAVDPATGMAVEGKLEVPYAGQPVTITLDATMSRDTEGAVAVYRWLSATMDPDAGTVRGRPAGQSADWPADTARVDVVLDRGEWVFNLWAGDAQGLFSVPDTITVEVGAADPVAECVGQIPEVVSEPCRTCVCGIESCRPMVIETGCDATCWALIQCVGAKCPDFQAMAAMMDYSCLTTNCMPEYTASMGGATPMGATPAGACARMCPAECTTTMM